MEATTLTPVLTSATSDVSIERPTAPTPRNNLLLYSGGTELSLEDLAHVVTPAPTKTHYPIAHSRLVSSVRDVLQDIGYAIESEQHAVDGEGGTRYFGLLQLQQEHKDNDYRFVLGLRNSHDKSCAVGLALGTRVLVCSNMSFSGEVTVMRKHTVNVGRDLDRMLVTSLGQLRDVHKQYEQRVERYREFELTDREAKGHILDMARYGVISSARVLEVWRQWERPAHEAFEPRTMWSLFNATTEVLKHLDSPTTLVTRSRRLHAVCDSWSGHAPHALEEMVIEA